MMNMAMPGVGSMRAGRAFAGVCQLLLAVGGAALICVWIIKVSYGIVQEELDQPVPQNSGGWMWKWGGVVFVASYVWTFISCVNLFRQAKAEERKNQEDIPPRLVDLPKKKQEKR
jgi:hypothetical protein